MSRICGLAQYNPNLLTRRDSQPSPLTPCFQPGPTSLREVGCALHVCSLRSLCLGPFLSITAHQIHMLLSRDSPADFCCLPYVVLSINIYCTLYNAQLLGLVLGTRLWVMHLLFPVGFFGIFILNRVYQHRNHCPPGKAEKHLPLIFLSFCSFEPSSVLGNDANRSVSSAYIMSLLACFSILILKIS